MSQEVRPSDGDGETFSPPPTPIVEHPEPTGQDRLRDAMLKLATSRHRAALLEYLRLRRSFR
jgi:hypothetical protein